jgi:hypothetical protein
MTDAKPQSLEAALSRATRTRWTHDRKTDTYRVKFAGRAGLGDAPAETIKDFEQVLAREFGRNVSGVVADNSGDLVISKALAEKITARFAALKAKDDKPALPQGRTAPASERFTRAFGAALKAHNDHLLEEDASYLAQLAVGFNGGSKPRAGVGRFAVEYTFGNARDADRFSDLLAGARNKAGIGRDDLGIELSRDGKTIRLLSSELLGLSRGEAEAFFVNADDAVRKEAARQKARGKEQASLTGTATPDAPGGLTDERVRNAVARLRREGRTHDNPSPTPDAQAPGAGAPAAALPGRQRGPSTEIV